MSNSDAKIKSITPYESYYGTSPDLSKLRVFGCKVLYYVPKDARDDNFKFSAVAEEGYFAGYGKNYYKILHQNKKTVIHVPHHEVVFYENAFGKDETQYE